MRYLRTVSTTRLLAVIAGVVVAIAAGTAIAVAATSGGPTPKPEPLAQSLHSGLTAPPVSGITANVHFTNNLIDSADFTGQTADPILQGASGRLWLSPHQLRLELQSDNGDSQVVVDHNSFWISDPASNTVYRGTLPADASGSATSGQKTAGTGVPTIAAIQSDINRLLRRVTLTGARTSDPTDVGGRPAYSVSISPKHDAGQLGALQLAWDAIKGVPLRIAVYARNNSTPVLELKLSDISYGHVAASDFAVSPPADYKVVKVSTGARSNPTGPPAADKKRRQAEVDGVAAVAGHVPFTLVAPKSLVGLPRHGVTLLDWAGTPAALLNYGQNLGGLAVIEQSASAGAGSGSASSPGPGGNLSLPTVSIHGATGQELDTALGTMVRFTRNGVAYTVIGSVTPYAADQAARALTR